MPQHISNFEEQAKQSVEAVDVLPTEGRDLRGTLINEFYMYLIVYKFRGGG